MADRLPSLRTLLLALALVGIALAGGGFLLAWSGLYNVAASRSHWEITRQFLEFGLRNSIATHSLGITVPPLDSPDLVRLGAGHFATGCAVCHGAPGEPPDPVFRRMLPAPPPLAEAAQHWDMAELFWIVRNGLKYTGMPSWVAPRRDDEVWAVVAFLRRLPGLDAASYRQLANLQDGHRPDPAAAQVPAACVRCHGDEGTAPISRLVPRLDGLSASYIEFSLRSYRAGTRSSGIMQQFAGPLDDATIRRTATYYADLPRPRPPTPEAASSADIDAGRRLAEAGVPAEGIPPCVACHEGRARALFPRLSGQPADYLVSQLELWRRGLRQETALGEIMAPIARRLSPDQMRNVAAYLETLPASGPR